MANVAVITDHLGIEVNKPFRIEEIPKREFKLNHNGIYRRIIANNTHSGWIEGDKFIINDLITNTLHIVKGEKTNESYSN